MIEADSLLTTAEVAEKLGVDRSRVRQLALDGQLDGLKPIYEGGPWLFRQSTVDAYAARRPARKRRNHNI